MTTVVNFPNRERSEQDRPATEVDNGISECLDILNMLGADVREGKIHGILVITFTPDGGSGLAMGGLFSPSRTLMALKEVELRTVISDMSDGN
jgi:hypothetical protein